MSVITDAAAAMNALTGQFAGTREEMVNFLITPADGGPDLDGNVLMTVSEGVQVKRPSLAKLLTVVGGVQGRYFMTYADMIAEPGEAFGQMATVAAEDGGTHTEPGGGSPVPNPGYYVWTDAATDYWKRVGNLITADIAAALTGAEAARDQILNDPGFIAVAADLAGADNIGAVAAALSNLAAVVANLEDIQAAPQAAIDAGEARDEVVAALASVPVGSSIIMSDGPPAVNTGQTGDRAYDTRNRVAYIAREASGWGIGIKAEMVPAPVAPRYDLARGALPAAYYTHSRATERTDLMPWDPYTRAPVVFPAGQPVRRADLGTGHFMGAKQFLDSPESPAAHDTVESVAAGVVIISGWGPSGSTAKVEPAASGGATISAIATVDALTCTTTGTGSDTLDGASGDVLVLTISSPGKLRVTPAGGLTRFNLTQNHVSPTTTSIVPFIRTRSICEADVVTGTATIRTLLSSGQGAMLVGCGWMDARSFARTPTVFSLNGVAAIFASAANGFWQYDIANNFSIDTTGKDRWVNGMATAIAWSGASLTFGAGSRRPQSVNRTFNNGVAVTSHFLGSSSNATHGNQNFNGFFKWIEIHTARPSDVALYDIYTSIPRPTIAANVVNYKAESPFPELKARCSALNAGLVRCAPIAMWGPSHMASVVGWRKSIAKRLATRLAAIDPRVHADAFAGGNGTSWSTSPSAHDDRASWTGSAPQLWGLQFGGDVLRIAHGATLTLTFDNAFERLWVPFYTGAGYGSFSISAGAGPIAPEGGGSSTVATTGASALTSKSFVKSGGAAAWTITSNGGAGTYLYLGAPVMREDGIPIINGGRNGFTAGNLAYDAGPESSFLLPIRQLNPALSIIMPDNTNSSYGTTPAMTLPAYRTAVAAQLAQGKALGDVIGITDPMSAPGVIPDARQIAYARASLAEMLKAGVPTFDMRRYQESAGYSAHWQSGFVFEATESVGLHPSEIANDWLFADVLAQMIAPALQPA